LIDLTAENKHVPKPQWGLRWLGLLQMSSPYSQPFVEEKISRDLKDVEDCLSIVGTKIQLHEFLLPNGNSHAEVRIEALNAK
jgi:hypothetical protein